MEPKHVVSRNTINQFQIDITRVMNKERHDTFFVLEGELFPLFFLKKNHGIPLHVPLCREFTTRQHVPHGIPGWTEVPRSGVRANTFTLMRQRYTDDTLQCPVLEGKGLSDLRTN